MAEKKRAVCWVIRHPELGTAWVIADDYEQATVKAAEWWGVPWGKNVAQMWVQARVPYMRHVCPRCGQIYNSDEPMCDKCLKIQETEQQETTRRLKATWWQGRKDKPFGQ